MTKITDELPIMELQPNKLYLIFATTDEIAESMHTTFKKLIEPLTEKPTVLILVANSKVVQKIITFE